MRTCHLQLLSDQIRHFGPKSWTTQSTRQLRNSNTSEAKNLGRSFQTAVRRSGALPTKEAAVSFNQLCRSDIHASPARGARKSSHRACRVRVARATAFGEKTGGMGELCLCLYVYSLYRTRMERVSRKPTNTAYMQPPVYTRPKC